MPHASLPDRASLEFLRKQGKDVLRELRRTNSHAQLAEALLAVARNYGFTSWRALKFEVERRQAVTIEGFFDACTKHDLAKLQDLLAVNPALTQTGMPGQPNAGWTALHEAAKRGDTAVLRLLLKHGADPDAREAGDNTAAIHWAAAQGHVETLRALLDAGSDVHGFGDHHQLDTIGWAAYFGDSEAKQEVVALLLERGAHHHIFSAIALGDLALIRALVEENPEALERRMSRFEEGQSPLHFAIHRGRPDIADLLIDLGADLEAKTLSGLTPMDVAIARADHRSMRRLQAAGAGIPEPAESPAAAENLSGLAHSVHKGVPMVSVPDIAATLRWYTAIGFQELARFGDGDVLNFGMVSFGKAEIMFRIGATPGPYEVLLWFYTDKVDDLYAALKSRQAQAAHAILDGQPIDGQPIAFVEEIHHAFYGAREFGIRDLNGYTLYFIQPD